MLDLEKFSKDIKNFFEGLANQVAKATGFVKRSRELTGSLFIKGLVFSLMKEETPSLETICITINELDPTVEITPQSLDERFTESAVKFLKEMLDRIMELVELPEGVDLAILQQFSEVNILDSSEWTLPESMKKFFKGSGGISSESAIKIQLVFEYLTGVYKIVETGDRREPDQGYGEHIIPHIAKGSLNLFDLGYFKLSFLGEIAEIAFFLSRLKMGVNVYETTKSGELKPINLRKKLSQAPKRTVTFNGVIGNKKNGFIKIRIVCCPISKQVARKRRKKIRVRAKREGYIPSKNTLYLANWNIFITNADEEMLTPEQILALYPLRWEIELVFKLWKSTCHINCVRTENVYRMLSELYARLIGIVVNSYLFYPQRNLIFSTTNREPSIFKAFSYFKEHSLEFAKSLRSKYMLLKFLLSTIKIISKYALLTQRKRKTTFKKLQLLC